MTIKALPVLHVFAISHYCEKARWALDHFNVPYQLLHIMPGRNRPAAKTLGLKTGSLPFLQLGDTAIGGSSAIIDWAETQRGATASSLTARDAAEAAVLEQRLDNIIGVHVRRFYYSDALFNDPASVRPIFARDLPFLQKWAVTLGWSKIVPLMIKAMDLGPLQGAESHDRLIVELDWLDGLLADGRRYLAGDAFSRVDITAASLLAPLITPAQHPTYATLALPVALARSIAPWRNRPILQWVKRIYAEHR
jgi:glutathione S-transferase